MGRSKRQAAPIAAARSLLDLPVSCLNRIACFMDGKTKLQFFRTSKGSQDAPGCAVLVLRAATKLEYKYFQPPDGNPRPALPPLLHWAAQICTNMELRISCNRLVDALHSLLLYPQARATCSSQALDSPVTYPGITGLDLGSYSAPVFMPELLADAFPNLKSLSARWWTDMSQPVVPSRAPARIEHVKAEVVANGVSNTVAMQHIAQQLSHMPSLTSIDVHSSVLAGMSAPAVLAQLRTARLELTMYRPPTDKELAALKACSQLDSLELHDGSTMLSVSHDWIAALARHVPTIRTLSLPSLYLDNEWMPGLLAMPNLTSLTVRRLFNLSDDHSNAPSSLKRLECVTWCDSGMAKLPLNALDSPVKCLHFGILLSDYAADLADVKAVKPHLLRCGGIDVTNHGLQIKLNTDSPITKEQVAEVLAEWASCLPVPRNVLYPGEAQWLFADAVAQLWPAAKVELIFDWYAEYVEGGSDDW